MGPGLSPEGWWEPQADGDRRWEQTLEDRVAITDFRSLEDRVGADWDWGTEEQEAEALGLA